MKNPLVDITTVNAVQSLFHGGIRDPWATDLAGQLADLIIYSDRVRYSLPVPGDGWRGLNHLQEPSLLVELAHRDSMLFSAEEYSTEEPIVLKTEYLGECFEPFVGWAKANRHTLSRWISLHNQPWIRPVQGPRARHGYVFLLEELEAHPDVNTLIQMLQVTRDDIYYSFDVVLRFPLYGQLAGEGQHYLNHPIRDAFSIPTMQRTADRAPQIAISFRKVISELAPKLTQDEYTALLHELRGHIRDAGLDKVRPGECDREVIRDIAAKVSLPPRLRGVGKAGAFVTALLGGISASPVLGPSAAVGGAAVSVSSLLWDGKLPRGITKMKWLRWAIEWDIETQIEYRK